MPKPPEVLRHGWGGDKELRDSILRERAHDSEEQRTHPHGREKFGSKRVPPDIVEADLEMFLNEKFIIRKKRGRA
jgi:hypothetical protein